MGYAANLSQLGLPEHVLDTLADAGVTDLQSWRGLGRRRLRLFGITRSTVALLDAAARTVTAEAHE